MRSCLNYWPAPARPRRPQTLGKIERFWGSLWRECIESAVFLDLADARQRIGLYIDYYNLQRPHQGIDGLAPADRFFSAAPEVLKTLKERLAANALEAFQWTYFAYLGAIKEANGAAMSIGRRVPIGQGRSRPDHDRAAAWCRRALRPECS